MSMDSTAWSSLYRTMNANTGPQRLTRETLRRIGRFASPHRTRLIQFLEAHQ